MTTPAFVLKSEFELPGTNAKGYAGIVDYMTDKEKVKKIAETKAKELKAKSEELVEYAKEKGTPVLKDAANELLAWVEEELKERQAQLQYDMQESKDGTTN